LPAWDYARFLLLNRRPGAAAHPIKAKAAGSGMGLLVDEIWEIDAEITPIQRDIIFHTGIGSIPCFYLPGN
jgi:hypothetical protein